MTPWAQVLKLCSSSRSVCVNFFPSKWQKKKLYSTDEARAIILAPNAQDTEEDIDASDYGENSDFEDENSSERDSFMPMNVGSDTL